MTWVQSKATYIQSKQTHLENSPQPCQFAAALKGQNMLAQSKWVTAVTRHRLWRGRTPPWVRIPPYRPALKGVIHFLALSGLSAIPPDAVPRTGLFRPFRPEQWNDSSIRPPLFIAPSGCQ